MKEQSLTEMSGSSVRPGLKILSLLALAMMGAGAVWGVAAQSHSAAALVFIVACLAVIGAAALFATALGALSWGRKTSTDTMTARIADTAGEGFVVVSLDDGDVVYANATYLALANVASLREAPSVPVLFGRSGEGADTLFRLARAAEKGEAAEEDVRLSRGFESGSPAWFRIATAPLSGAHDGALVLWSIRDITRERGKQESVFQELQFAIDYLDHAPAGFVSINRDGEIVYGNVTLAQWIDRDLADLNSSMRLKDIVTQDGETLLSTLRGAPGDTRIETVDCDLRMAKGSLRPVRLLHQVSFDEQGYPGASRTLVLDRSDSLSPENGQQAAEVRFARFFNNSPFAIATITQDARLVRTNASFLRLLGRNEADNRDPAHTALLDFVAQTDRVALSDRIAAALAGRGGLQPLDVQLASDGRSARIYVTGLPSSGTDGEAAIVYVLDITEQRALEVQFAQAQKMQAVGELAGGVAHDFNNVLQGILGYADLLLANHRPTDPSFQDIMQIKQNANRAASLVRHLLAFSRRQTLRPVVVQLTDALSDLSTLLKRLLGQQIELDVRHERDLWSVKADPTQFEQVIVNLAVNARDAMPKGGRLSIRTANLPSTATASLGDATIPSADYVMVEISDTGSGIPAEHLDKIFEPFFTTKDVGKGTGLGLSMVYGFVKQSGGFILCDSALGKGTRFRILLPRHIVTEAELEASTQTVADKPAAVDLSGQGTILLVEDEDAVRAFGSRALTQRGYRVLEAASGVEALEIIEKQDVSVDLIVSDVVMPEMDGPTLLKEIRARGIKARVIFVSGYAEDAFRRNLPEGEDFGFLPKPFSLKDLIATVKSAIG
jgi:two-component system, cell cycle sensor histidine kinase and response regulator CckA